MIWDAKSKRYRGEQGRFIKRSSVLSELERVRDGYKGKVVSLSQQLQKGEINLAAWQIAIRDEIKAMHLTAAAVANGGLKQMSPSALGRLGAATKKEYQFLNKFARQIQNGLPLNGRFLNRVKLYVNASRGTFYEAERKMKRDAGYDEERNILNAKESCSGCLDEASKGWVKIGELSPVGTRQCLSNCLCEIETRKAA